MYSPPGPNCHQNQTIAVPVPVIAYTGVGTYIGWLSRTRIPLLAVTLELLPRNSVALFVEVAYIT
jgi:hypothetical protein